MRVIIIISAIICLALEPMTLDWAHAAEESVQQLLRNGFRFQSQGFYLAARDSYQRAYQQALQSGNAEQQALAQAALGYGEYLLNRLEIAAPLLTKARDYAQIYRHPGLLATSSYYLGLLAQSQNKPEAKAILLTSLASAQGLSDPLLLGRIQIAPAEEALSIDELDQHQQQALAALHGVDEPGSGEIHLLLAEQAWEHPLFQQFYKDSARVNQHLAYVYELLEKPKPRLVPENHRHLARFYALKAKLYEAQQRREEALQLTRQAIQKLDGDYADDLLMFYEWQAGRLYKSLGQNDLALESYRRAVNHVQAIRQDIPVTYQDGKSSFLELFGPLYREMIELLLKQASDNAVPAAVNNLLPEAQNIT